VRIASGRARLGLAFALVAATAACAIAPPPVRPDRLALEPVEFEALPGWPRDDVAEALGPMRRSCARLMRLDDDAHLGIAGRVRDWRPVCGSLTALAGAASDEARAWWERHFRPYRASNDGRAEALVTGYYEPELKGALARDAIYSVPIYAVPPDLVQVDLGEFREGWRGERIAGRLVGGRLRPYPSRAEIEAGALAGRDLELAWVDDPVDVFFLHIQGSGRIRLGDGRSIRLGFAGQNGHRYVAIGRPLVERGALGREAVSMQTIRDWLARHPGEAREVMNLNPSYVFFRRLDREVRDDEGPIGAEGTPLTAGRSLAVDRSFIPLGVPVWLDLDAAASPGGRLQRLTIAQDTGGAIRGPVRGDFFWGTGAAAGERAGPMKASGALYLLLPRGIPAS
jgi:membrane-bound lytic murein transglycosylase A